MQPIMALGNGPWNPILSTSTFSVSPFPEVQMRIMGDGWCVNV